MGGDVNSAGEKARTETVRGAVRGLIKVFGFVVVSAVVLFASAGRLDWTWGWVFVALSLLSTAASALAVSAELQAERAGVGEGVKGWDILLALLMARLLPLAVLLVAGLDVAANGTAQVSLALRVAALLVAGLGVALTIWAMRVNAFFSGLVRIQEERGHTVVTGGPYRAVRHPGYVGAVLYDVAVPLVLGSWWAFAPTAFLVGVIVVRTALEDRTLRAELPGYREYARRTRFRLLPGVW